MEDMYSSASCYRADHFDKPAICVGPKSYKDYIREGDATPLNNNKRVLPSTRDVGFQDFWVPLTYARVNIYNIEHTTPFSERLT